MRLHGRSKMTSLVAVGEAKAWGCRSCWCEPLSFCLYADSCLTNADHLLSHVPVLRISCFRYPPQRPPRVHQIRSPPTLHPPVPVPSPAKAFSPPRQPTATSNWRGLCSVSPFLPLFIAAHMDPRVSRRSPAPAALLRIRLSRQSEHWRRHNVCFLMHARIH